MLLWCVWLCGTVFFLFALDLSRRTGHMAYIRYPLIVGPAIYAALAAMFRPVSSGSRLRRWLPHVVPACIVISCLGSLAEAYEVPNIEYRQLASYLDNNVAPDDIVVFYTRPEDFWFCNAMFLNTSFYCRSYPWPFMMTTHPPDDAMRDRLSRAHCVWLVVSQASGMSGEMYMPGARVDGFQGFPYLANCERITPNPKTILRPTIPPKNLAELR
jgi:hypothetical protein